MRDYKQVVAERYDVEMAIPENNKYSLYKPVGCYGYCYNVQLLRRFLRKVKKSVKKEVSEITLLDCGCGRGSITRIMAELTENPQKVCGFEYSEKRLRFAKNMNPAIEYKLGDLVREIPDMQTAMFFDGITAIDVFMHLRKREEVIQGLKNIISKLDENGIFMWIDTAAVSHFIDNDEDHCGFSYVEMIELASEVGFEEIAKERIHPVIPFLGSTYYMSEKYSYLLCMALEKMRLFRKYTNIIVYFKKKNEIYKEE